MNIQICHKTNENSKTLVNCITTHLRTELGILANLCLKKTKAIIIVHLYGYTVNFNSIIAYCKKKKIKIIEDCAQSFGSELNGKKSGTRGDFACYSFHAQKNITTLGEGGMLYVKDKKLSKKVSGLRHNGHCEFNFKRKSYWLPAMGNLDLDVKNKWPYKFTLSEVQCGAGIIMIKKLDYLNSLLKYYFLFHLANQRNHFLHNKTIKLFLHFD